MNGGRGRRRAVVGVIRGKMERAVQKWDYLIVWLADARHAQEAALNGAPFAIPNSITRERGKPELGPLLAYLGAEGWELAGSAFTWALIFKRPKG